VKTLARAAALLSLGVITLLASRSAATIVLRIDPETLARTSDLIVLGRVLDARARVAERGIETAVTIGVEEDWSAPGAGTREVRFDVHGGRVGDRAMFVHGQATFVVGEEVVVFLYRDGDRLWPNAMAQGKWRVVPADDGGRWALSSAASSSLFERSESGALVPSERAPDAMRIEALRERVLRARSER
jgi:hypothetical protein